LEADLFTENNELNLPEDWVMTSLGQVVDLNPPKPSKNALPQDAEVTFVPMPAVDAQSGAITSPESRPFASVRKGYTSFRDGDVIFAKITPCMENGKAAIARNMINGLGFGSTEFHVLRPRESVISQYVYYYIRQESFRRAAEAEMTGSVGQKRVPSEYLKNADFPLPPIAEQKRLVAKIEELLPKVNAVRERLLRVKEIMKRFRQSVLSAACSGRLTEDWRDSARIGESAEKLLESIVSAKTEIQDGDLERNKARTDREKARTIREPNPEFESDAPDSWAIASMDALTSLVTSGSRAWKKFYSADGPGTFIMGQNVRPFRLEFSHKIKVNPPENDPDRRRSEVMEGDLLVTIAGNTGDVCRVPGPLKEHYVCQSVALLRPILQRLSPFLEVYLNSPLHGQSQFRELVYGEGRPHLSFEHLKALCVFLPPLEEQNEIVNRVQTLFELADKIERRLEVELSRTEKLTQGIFAKAFRGELVPSETELRFREELIGDKWVTDESGVTEKEAVIYTIGHSIHKLEKLLNLLNKNGIEVLVDIRSKPYSRNVPHFNKDNLEKEIRKSGLKYLFLGKELGGRPTGREFYDPEGFVLYSRIAQTNDFKQGIERIMKGIRDFRVALMCSEENPLNCHRHLLVSRVLSDRHVKIFHIRGDGSIQSYTEISNDRYVPQTVRAQQSLFVSEEPSEWKSTQSVLRRKVPNSSSEG
jgi:type I restriction enzyme, S subunit